MARNLIRGDREERDDLLHSSFIVTKAPARKRNPAPLRRATVTVEFEGRKHEISMMCVDTGHERLVDGRWQVV